MIRMINIELFVVNPAPWATWLGLPGMDREVGGSNPSVDL